MRKEWRCAGIVCAAVERCIVFSIFMCYHSYLSQQSYIRRPYLVDGSKCDLRLYCIVMGSRSGNVRAYVHSDGLARVATESYKYRYAASSGCCQELRDGS